MSSDIKPGRRRASWRRSPLAWLLGLGVFMHLGSLAWGIPGADSWANDSVAARDHLAGVALNLQPGNFFRYPLFHLLLLALLSVPSVVLALGNVGLDVTSDGFQQRFIAEIVREPYMTWAMISGRVVTVAMSAVAMWALYRIANRLWGRQSGLFALAILLGTTWFNYYSQTTNLDVPQLMWVLLAVHFGLQAMWSGEHDGKRWRKWAAVSAALAVATKDQAAGVLLLGLPAVALLGWLDRDFVAHRQRIGAPVASFKSTLRFWLPAIALAAAVYVVASGALFNPTGYVARVKWLLGPASGEWTEYDGNLAGRGALLIDAWHKLTTEAYLRPIGWASAFGTFGVAVAGIRGRRWTWCLPLVLVGSMTALFNLGALRTSPRFLLSQSVMLALGGGWFFARTFQLVGAMSAWRSPARKLLFTGFSLLFVFGLSWAMRVNVAMWTDARTAAYSWLKDNAPAGCTLEVYAKNFALLRVPSHLAATRVRQTPLHKRNPIVGLKEVRAPFEDVTERDPDLVALVDKHYKTYLAKSRGAHRRRSRLTEQRSADQAARQHFETLLGGDGTYRTVFSQGPARLWPWPPMFIHASLSPTVVVLARDGTLSCGAASESGRQRE